MFKFVPRLLLGNPLDQSQHLATTRMWTHGSQYGVACSINLFHARPLCPQLLEAGVCWERGGGGGEVNAALWREQRGTVKLGKHHNVLAAELNNVLATVLNLLRQFYLLILA